MTTAPTTSGHGRHWSPETMMGRWTLGLACLGIVGIATLALALAAGMQRADSFTDDWFLLVWGSATLVSSAAAGVTGVLALFRAHDRAWWVVAATVLGVVVALAMLQQVAEGLGWLSS